MSHSLAKGARSSCTAPPRRSFSECRFTGDGAEHLGSGIGFAMIVRKRYSHKRHRNTFTACLGNGRCRARGLPRGCVPARLAGPCHWHPRGVPLHVQNQINTFHRVCFLGLNQSHWCTVDIEDFPADKSCLVRQHEADRRRHFFSSAHASQWDQCAQIVREGGGHFGGDQAWRHGVDPNPGFASSLARNRVMV